MNMYMKGETTMILLNRFFRSKTSSFFRKQDVIYKACAMDDDMIYFMVDDLFNKDKWKSIDYGCACRIKQFSNNYLYNFYKRDFNEIYELMTLDEYQRERSESI